MTSEYLLLFIIFIFSPHLPPRVQNTPPYLGPCVSSAASYRREPGARPGCPVTRGSKCVFWVLSGTEPQYLPRGRTHVPIHAGKADRSRCSGSIFGRVPVCFSTVLFQGECAEGALRTVCVAPLPWPFTPRAGSRGGVGVPRGRDGRSQCQPGAEWRHRPVPCGVDGAQGLDREGHGLGGWWEGGGVAGHVPGWACTRGSARSSPAPTPAPAGRCGSASTTQSHEQRSGPAAAGARRARARGRMGEVLSDACTPPRPRLHQPAAPARTPASPRPKSRKDPDSPGEPFGGWGWGPPGAEGSAVPRRSPFGSRHLPLPSLRRPGSPGSAAPARELSGRRRRAALRGRRPAGGREGGGGSGEGGGGAGGGRGPAPTQAAREGILGTGPAPSRGRRAGPRAASGRAASTRGRKTAAAAGVSRPGEAAGKLPSAAAPPPPSPPQALGTPPFLSRSWGPGCTAPCQPEFWGWGGGGGDGTRERSSRFPDPPPPEPLLSGVEAGGR